jgi:hypothetical protein
MAKIKVTLGNLAKLAKIHKELKKLDSEIIALEKMAMLLANNKTEVSFTLSVIDLDVKDCNKAHTNENGDLMMPDYMQATRNMLANMYGVHPDNVRMHGDPRVKPKNKIGLKETIDDTTGLSILGVILGHKQSTRSALLYTLKQLGIEV